MAIVAGEILFRLSGGAANSNVNLSLGGAKSSVAVTDNVVDNLFDSVSGTESAAGDVEYRAIYYHNGNASLTAQNARVYITSNTTASGDTLDIAVGTAAINATEQTVADESTPPTGVTWGAPTDYAGAATNHGLGNVPNGQHKAIWIRRTVTGGASAVDANAATIQIGVDTAA
jgi:hypothetical protein